MTDRGIVRISRDPVRMTFLLSQLCAEGLDADLKHAPTGLWQLLVPVEQDARARWTLRNLDAEDAAARVRPAPRSAWLGRVWRALKARFD